MDPASISSPWEHERTPVFRKLLDDPNSVSLYVIVWMALASPQALEVISVVNDRSLRSTTPFCWGVHRRKLLLFLALMTRKTTSYRDLWTQLLDPISGFLVSSRSNFSQSLIMMPFVSFNFSNLIMASISRCPSLLTYLHRLHRLIDIVHMMSLA